MLASPNNKDLLGQFQVHLSCVDSTNNYAANLLKAGKARSGTVILADEQTNGRGQRGAVWQSEPGMNLQFSALWMPEHLSITAQKYMNFAVVVALVRYFKKKTIVAHIKWPNDILVQGRKIGGVLIESTINENSIGHTIIGVGLNVNQTEFGNLNATSLKNQLGQFFPVREVLDGVLYELNFTLGMLLDKRFNDLDTLYFKHLYGFNQYLEFQDKNGFFRGEIRGVDDFGNVQIEKNGQVVSYGIKEIKFVN